jgi:hypothetical protein
MTSADNVTHSWLRPAGKASTCALPSAGAVLAMNGATTGCVFARFVELNRKYWRPPTWLLSRLIASSAQSGKLGADLVEFRFGSPGADPPICASFLDGLSAGV